MLLRRHGEAVRADLRREYGVDLLDLWRGGLGVQEVAGLVRYLPPGSAVWRETGGPAAWSPEVEMGAAIELAVRTMHWASTEDAKHRRNAPEPLKPPVAEDERLAAQRAVVAEARRFQERYGKG